MSRSFDLLNSLDTPSFAPAKAEARTGVAPSYASILADELAQIESIVGHTIGKLKAVVEEGADAARSEKESAERTIASLENDLMARAGQLRDVEQSLQSRDREIDAQRQQIAELEQSLQQARTLAAIESDRAASASAKTAQLERLISEQDARVAASDQLAAALQAEVARLKDGILEMVSLVQVQAKSLARGCVAITTDGALVDTDLTRSAPLPSAPPRPSSSVLFDR